MRTADSHLPPPYQTGPGPKCFNSPPVCALLVRKGGLNRLTRDRWHRWSTLVDLYIFLYNTSQKAGDPMRTVSLTEFRNRVSVILTEVEGGEELVVLRHGRPVARVSPVTQSPEEPSSWKRPALRLTVKGADLSTAILEGRDREDLL